MPDIKLPSRGEKPYDTRLNAAIMEINQAVDEASDTAASAATTASRVAAVVEGGRLSEQALGATIAEAVEGLPVDSGPITDTVILFGTSLEAQNGSGAQTLDAPVNFEPLQGRGWFHWANAYLGNPLTLVRNAGIGGNTYAQMRARLDADVLAHDADWVFVGAPMNDVASGRTAAAIIADGVAMLDKLSRRRVLMMTHPPHQGVDTVTERAVLTEVNTWIRSLPDTRKNVIVADAWRVLSNGVSAAPSAGMTAGATTGAEDGVHYSVAAAARVGVAAADAIRGWVSARPHRVTSAADPKCFVANPSLASGTGWSVQGSGVTVAYGADDDTLTTKATLTFTGVTSTGNLGIQCQENISGGRWATGDVIQASARIRWADIAPLGVPSNFGPLVQITLRATDNTIREIFWGFTPSSQWVAPVNVPKSGDTVVTTPRVTIPATLASGAAVDRVEVRVGFRGIASGVVTVSDIAPVKM